MRWSPVGLGRIEMSDNMKIYDLKGLEQAVSEINVRIQAIDEFLGANDESRLSEEYLMRLPRNYIRTASCFRESLNIIDDEVLRKNISYHLQLSDLYSYIMNRMHIWGVIRDMIVKYQVVNMAAITESILSHVAPKRCNTKNLRVGYLVTKNLIDEDVKSELDWLWGVRNGVHIHEVRHPEIGVYTDEMFDRAMLAVKCLIDALEQNKS